MNKTAFEIFKKQTAPWYKEGLHFECTECGGCCTGASGYVWVDEEEIHSMAHFLGLSIQKFADRYLIKVDHRYSLRENPYNYDCPFLENKRCTIYSVRPKQCRTFPWWIENLQSEAAWQEAAKRCEGIRPEARLVPLGEIQTQLHS